MNLVENQNSTGNPVNITAINFSDCNYELVRKYNTETALTKGFADKVFEYGPEDLDEKYHLKFAEQIKYKRGYGLWSWKPYIILNAMKMMREGDYLFYCDAGAIYLKPIRLLWDDLVKSRQDIMVFELPLLEREWTKKETFISMDHEDNSNQRLATSIFIKNTEYSRNFITEWLEYCADIRCNVPEVVTEIENYPGFIAHRDDQSVFSILSKKWVLQPFRDPSQYGDRPWEYQCTLAYKRRYGKKWTCVTSKKYPNSKYPKILLSVRKCDPSKILKRERILSILSGLGVYNKYTYLWRQNLISLLR